MAKTYQTQGDKSVAQPVFLIDPTSGAATAANGSNTADGAIIGVVAITASNTVTVTAGRQLLINCTVAGNVKVQFSDASTITIPVQVGLTILPWAVIQLFVTGTTATATYYNLL